MRCAEAPATDSLNQKFTNKGGLRVKTQRQGLHLKARYTSGKDGSRCRQTSGELPVILNSGEPSYDNCFDVRFSDHSA